MVFKVPPLRNVAETAPYFHDSSAPDLPTAVRQMARAQLDLDLDDRRVEDIVAFLGALTGRIPADLVATPHLPPTNPATPLPDGL